MRTESAGRKKGLKGKTVLFGVGVSELIMLAMAGAAAGLVSTGGISEEWMDEASAVILLTSSFLGCLTAGRGGEQVMSALAVGVGYWAALVAMQGMLFVLSLKGTAAVGLAVAGGAGASVLLQPRRRGKYRGRKRGYR